MVANIKNEGWKRKCKGKDKLGLNYLQSTSGSTKTNKDSKCSTSKTALKDTDNRELSEKNEDQQMNDIPELILATNSDSPPSPNESTIDTNVAPTESVQQPLSTDPAIWPMILPEAERTFLVRQGPPKPFGCSIPKHSIQHFLRKSGFCIFGYTVYRRVF